MERSFVCYFRKTGRPWQPAPSSYGQLLSVYEEFASAHRNEPITVCTTAEDGQVLMAHIQTKPHMLGVYLCRVVTENGEGEEVIELMRGPRALRGSVP